MLKKAIPLFILAVAIFLTSCQSSNKESVRDVLEKDPTILTEIMLKNPDLFMDALQKMAADMRQKALNSRNEKEKQSLEQAFKNPLKVESHSDDLVIGNPNAEIKIYEYSDFQCPFCHRALDTITELLEEYNGKVSFVYRHLPIDSIHPNARLAAKYYEAVRIIDEKKAFEFHKIVLNNQAKLKHGDKYFKSIVKDLKINEAKVQKLLNSERVDNKISYDIESANKLGFSGTPGFVVGGIPVKGAYPYSHFKMIIDRLLKVKTASAR